MVERNVACLLDDGNDGGGGGGDSERSDGNAVESALSRHGHTRAVCDVANNIRKGDTIGGRRMSDGEDLRTMNTIQQSTKNSRGRLRR
jgi:hypothetical protein